MASATVISKKTSSKITSKSKPKPKRTTFSSKDSPIDTAKKAKVVNVDIIEKRAAKRYQKKHPAKVAQDITLPNGSSLKYIAAEHIKPGHAVQRFGPDLVTETYDLRQPARNAVRTAIHSTAHPRAFRPLNSRELGKLSAELIKRNPDGGPRIPPHHPLANPQTVSFATVSYENMQGGFCVCIISLVVDSGRAILLWRGASRRSYKDRPDEIKGQMQAFERAILYSRAERVPV